MPATTNADQWLAQVTAAWHQLGSDLVEGNFQAAKAGVWEAQQDHPYTDRTQDLTNTAHPIYNFDGQGNAAMNWPMFYAPFVNFGTSRSKPYPFVPIAKRKADADLKWHTRRAVERFIGFVKTRK